MVFSSSNFASGLNTLEFTQSYIDCVKSFSAESTFSETVGKAESGLMNGRVLNGNIDSNYWSFMNCITPAVSGTIATSVPTIDGCTPEVREMTSPDIQVYLPFKQEGSLVNINGHEFSCTSSGWRFISSTGQERRHSCAAETVTVDACAYDIPALEHNKGGVFNSVSTGSDGKIVGVCNNGQTELSGATCSASECEVGERVTWSESVAEEMFFCEGSVTSNGFASASLSNIQYFPTQSSARASSIVPSGNAQYVCRDGRWDRVEGVGSCRYKAPAEKVCNEIAIGKAIDHFCQ
tara:strand:+ start:8562 stop:9440 length:879 start_codon:yes stop_codon:yes gene_type:complete